MMGLEICAYTYIYIYIHVCACIINICKYLSFIQIYIFIYVCYSKFLSICGHVDSSMTRSALCQIHSGEMQSRPVV